MILRDVDGSFVWFINIFGFLIRFINLIIDGILVFLNVKGEIIWKLFDYLIDILYVCLFFLIFFLMLEVKRLRFSVLSLNFFIG